jgi:hypothetical protein
MICTLGQQLLASHPAPAAPESIGHILHLIAKAYKISIVADLSPHQARQESIVQWGTFLLQIVCRVIPEEAQPEDKEDREKWAWWKAKKLSLTPTLCFSPSSSIACTTPTAHHRNYQATARTLLHSQTISRHISPLKS